MSACCVAPRALTAFRLPPLRHMSWKVMTLGHPRKTPEAPLKLIISLQTRPLRPCAHSY